MTDGKVYRLELFPAPEPATFEVQSVMIYNVSTGERLFSGCIREGCPGGGEKVVEEDGEKHHVCAGCGGYLFSEPGPEDEEAEP